MTADSTTTDPIPPSANQALLAAPDRASTDVRGLTAAQVTDRIAQGQTNAAHDHTSRSLNEIIRANVFTRFNAILGTMLVVVLALGDFRDALFGVVLVSNALIGIVQEYRAKRKLDSLAVLYAPRAVVIRAGTAAEVAIETVVLDDLVELKTGDQVPVDGVARSVHGLEVDESLLTGESDAVVKQLGDSVLSGSFVVGGRGVMQATRVGDDAYARQLAAQARRFTKSRSELMDGIDQILKYVTWLIVPTAILMFTRAMTSTEDGGVRDALISTVAGVVGMVPEGLVLLTSIAFLVAALTLAQRKVLVQELPAVEGLARVDVFCADKTGTLTEGTIAFDTMVLLDGDDATVRAALGAMATAPDANATLHAVATACPAPNGWDQIGAVPFNSARKWSAATYADQGTWVIGAPEMVRPDVDATVDTARRRADVHAADGHRVLLLAHTDAAPAGETLPADLVPQALVLLDEVVRPDAAETLEFFRDQGVSLRVISGDNPRTVAAVAARVGIDVGEPIDARTLPEDQEALADILEANIVFGRVTPQQKRAFVGALQSRGHVVAMTGDGVNDALALKDADIGVAMGSGSAATRSVAQIVLLDDQFARMPGVVAEGRRVLANVERVANLFVTKAVYVFLLAVSTGLIGVTFPFLPRHLTLISSVTIGIPAFFLALGPNRRRFVPGFIGRVLRFAIPSGGVAAVVTLASYLWCRNQDATVNVARTGATFTLAIVALWVLVVLARPYVWWKFILVGAMALGVPVVYAIPYGRDFFALDPPRGSTLWLCLVLGAVGAVGIEVISRLRWLRTAPRASDATQAATTAIRSV